MLGDLCNRLATRLVTIHLVLTKSNSKVSKSHSKDVVQVRRITMLITNNLRHSQTQFKMLVDLMVWLGSNHLLTKRKVLCISAKNQLLMHKRRIKILPKLLLQMPWQWIQQSFHRLHKCSSQKPGQTANFRRQTMLGLCLKMVLLQATWVWKMMDQILISSKEKSLLMTRICTLLKWIWTD